MSDYIYTNPLDEGYKQFKLTKKQHNELFQYRQIQWRDKYEYYYNENHIIMHKFVNLPSKILITILFPIFLLIYGIGNFKELIEEMKRGYNQKKYGSFTGDDIYKGSTTYNKVMEIINKKEGIK